MLNKKYAPKDIKELLTKNIILGPLERFYKGALDPTTVFNSLKDVQKYLSDPNANHYDCQFVSVIDTGKIYILRESGSIIEFATIDELSKLYEELSNKISELRNVTDAHEVDIGLLKERQNEQDKYNASNDQKIESIEKDISDITESIKSKYLELVNKDEELKEKLDDLANRIDASINAINESVSNNSKEIKNANENIAKIEKKLDNVKTINGESIFGEGNIELLAKLDADEIKKLIDSGAIDLDAGFATDKELNKTKEELLSEIQKKQDKLDHSIFATKEDVDKKVDKDDIKTVSQFPGKIAGYDENGNLHSATITNIHTTTDSTVLPTLKDVKDLIKYSIDTSEHPFNKNSFKTIDGQSILVSDDGITNIETHGNTEANIELPSENYSNPLSSVKISGEIYTIPRVIADATNSEGTVITSGSTLQNIKIDDRVYSLPNKINITQDILNDEKTISTISTAAQGYHPTDSEADKIVLNKVGGVDIGTDLTGKTISDIIQEILIGGNKPLHDKYIYYGLSECDPEDDISTLTNDDILAGKTINAYTETDLEELVPVKKQSIFIAIPTKVNDGVSDIEYTVDTIKNSSNIDVIGMFYTDSRELNGTQYKIYITDKRSIASKYKIQISKKGG